MRSKHLCVAAFVAVLALSPLAASALEMNYVPFYRDQFNPPPPAKTFKELCDGGMLKLKLSRNIDVASSYVDLEINGMSDERGYFHLRDYAVVPVHAEHRQYARDGKLEVDYDLLFITMESFSCSMLVGDRVRNNDGTRTETTTEVRFNVNLSLPSSVRVGLSDDEWKRLRDAFFASGEPVYINGRVEYTKGGWFSDVKPEERTLGNMLEVTLVIRPSSINGISLRD